MMKCWVPLISVFLVIVYQSTGLGDAVVHEIQEDRQQQTNNKDETSVSIYYDHEHKPEESYKSGLARLYNNPALRSGLRSGAQLLNRSVDTLIESLFYRLLDQDFEFSLSSTAQFVLGFSRDLYSIPSGGYVVVDRFGLGPEYEQLLSRVQDINITLGSQGRLNMYDIYITSDARRLYLRSQRDMVRNLADNWFGLLPLLARFLPPSFNANELYDPLRLVETPFSFPISIGGFEAMRVGSIRSYNISGGVTIPLDFSEKLPLKIRQELKKYEGITATLPYSVFVEGEYRINVLRKSRDVAWVGLTRTKTLGQKINMKLGQTLILLKKLITDTWWWRGVPFSFLPFNFEFKDISYENVFDQLYVFDLRYQKARQAYLKAVRGDFTLASTLARQRQEKNNDQGVTFHFTQTKDIEGVEFSMGPSLILVNSNRRYRRQQAEIEIVDQQGPLYILRGEKVAIREFSDAITGKTQTQYSTQLDLDVEKEKTSKSGRYRYVFRQGSHSPQNLIVNFEIQDRYCDAHEFHDYIRRIRHFLRLPLHNMPNIPLRDASAIMNRQRRAVFFDAARLIELPHVTPIHLGRFSATASLQFHAEQLKHVFTHPSHEVCQAYLKAFQRKHQAGSLKGFCHQLTQSHLKWSSRIISALLASNSIKEPNLAFSFELARGLEIFAKWRPELKPKELLQLFYELFDTDYFDEQIHVLLSLSDLDRVPRSVHFYTEARSSLPENLRDQFHLLKDRVYRSPARFKFESRSAVPDKKLGAFYPQSIRELEKRAEIKRIELRVEKLPKTFIKKVSQARYSYPDITLSELYDSYPYISLCVATSKTQNLPRLYFRLEQLSSLQLGSFVLAEKVFAPLRDEFQKIENQQSECSSVFGFYLLGPLSPFIEDYGRQLANGRYRVRIAISEDGLVWSNEREFTIRLIFGHVAPDVDS